jgi:hypothetical protein
MSSPWINGRRWDLFWLVGSCAVVPAGLAAVRAGAPADWINLGVTALVGGPHLFSTFLATYLDPGFRRAHRWALGAIAVLVPAFVVVMTAWDFQILLSFFIFAASLHVLQQNAYLAGVYRRRASVPDPAWSRWIDTGLLFLSFYPVASYKLVRDDFLLGDVAILIPPFVKSDLTVAAISAAFGILLAAWIAKTVLEQRRGALNVPKTVLIGVTTAAAFVVPAAAGGERLELAFQTVNAWHSIQYLAILWLALKLRKERGLPQASWVARLSGPGRLAVLFYGAVFATTLATLAAVTGVIRWDPIGFTKAQYDYMSILSLLFIHYALDTYLFFAAGRAWAKPDEIPLAAPSAI